MSDPIRLVVLTGDLNQAVGGLPAIGWVLISSYKMVRAPGANMVITSQPKPVKLVDGRFGVLVPVSTQVTFEEQCLIEVQVLLQDTRPEALVLVVETDQDTLDIADAVRVPVMDTDTTVPVVPWRSVGVPGGVVPLGPSGKILAQFLPASSGGMVGWWEGDGPPPEAIPGAAPGDMYYDRIGSDFYQLQ